MSCNKIQAAVITPVLAAGSVASPYFYEVNITQRLCYPTCADNTPVFNPQFSLKSLSQVGTGRYVATVHVEGIISYVPCNGGCGCTKQQPLSQVGIDTHRNHRAGSRDERRGGISLPAVQPDIRIGDADHRNGGNGRNPNSVAVCCG